MGKVRMDEPRVAAVLDKYLTIQKMGGKLPMPEDRDKRGDPETLWKTRLKRWEVFQGYAVDELKDGYKVECLCSCVVCEIIRKEAGV